MKIGEIIPVQNKNKKFGANLHYHAVHVCIEGKVVPLLLSHGELEIAKDRAERNMEDIPKLSWFQRLFK